MTPGVPPVEAPLVLASASPRRTEILRTLGLDHEVHPARVDEVLLEGEGPRGHAERLAREKAEAVASKRPDAWVLAGDTVVTLEGVVLGKPRDREDAVEMLLRLAGREHDVVSGLALARPRTGSADASPESQDEGRILSGVQVTRVRFRSFDAATARAYADTDEPLDKAGAYAIQGRGAVLVEGIMGDYSGVVGLPVPLLVRLLDRAGRPFRF
jgi:septum formation protein